MPENTSKNLILWFFICLFLVSFYMIGWLLWPFVSIIVIAAVVSGLFSPVFRFITLTDKISPSFASFLTCLLIFLLLFVPIAFFVGILSKEAYELYIAAKDAVLGDQIQQLLEGNIWIEKIKAFLARFNIEVTGEQVNAGVSQLAKVVGFFLYDQARSIAYNMFAFVINFFLMLLVIYYLLIDGDRLVNFIIDISPLPDDQNQALFTKFKDMAGAILIGNGLGGLVQGSLGGTVFAFFGFTSPFLWGVIMGLLAFLPILGIGLVFIPAAIYLFLTSKTAAGIFFIVFYVILSGVVEYLFKPKLVGQRVQMHTLLVFFSIVGGLKLFGILGIIYGPLVVTGFLTLTDIYHTSYQQMVESAEPSLVRDNSEN
jgi:predicted PurR-regulated permease PerM